MKKFLEITIKLKDILLFNRNKNTTLIANKFCINWGPDDGGLQNKLTDIISEYHNHVSKYILAKQFFLDGQFTYHDFCKRKTFIYAVTPQPLPKSFIAEILKNEEISFQASLVEAKILNLILS